MTGAEALQDQLAPVTDGREAAPCPPETDGAGDAGQGDAASPAAIQPVDSLRKAAVWLRRPFTAEAAKFKVQGTFGEKGKPPQRGMVVTYIDARLVVERLNLIVPDLWFDRYELVDGGLVCHLTVDGVTRSDVGQHEDLKARYSDALKRAAVKFGVGVSLYAVPRVYLPAGDGKVKRGTATLKPKQTRKGPSLALTPDAESWLRKNYDAWLELLGAEAFGEPLDHGDAPDAVGDPVELADEQPVDTGPEPVSDPEGVALLANLDATYAKLAEADPKAMLRGEYEALKRSAWHDKNAIRGVTAIVTEKLEVSGGAS